MVPLGEPEIDDWLAGEQRQVETSREHDVFEREHADRGRRQCDAVTDMHAGYRRQIDAGTVAKRPGWDDVTEVLHESEIAFECERLIGIQIDRDVQLLGAAGAEREGREMQRDSLKDVEAEVGEIAV